MPNKESRKYYLKGKAYCDKHNIKPRETKSYTYPSGIGYYFIDEDFNWHLSRAILEKTSNCKFPDGCYLKVGVGIETLEEAIK